jgi:CBS domain containing-hemolysin-like protein
MTFVYLLAAFFLVLLNGFFVLAEFAAVKMRPSRVRELQNDESAVRQPQGTFRIISMSTSQFARSASRLRQLVWVLLQNLQSYGLSSQSLFSQGSSPKMPG